MPVHARESGEQGGRRQASFAFGFLVLSLVVFFLPTSVQQQLAGALRVSFLWPFLVTQEVLVEGRMRAAEVAVLRADIDSLTTRLVNLRGLEEENRRLRELLSLSARIGSSYRAATVVRAQLPGSESMFILNLGYEDGVRVGSPVLVGEGLIGVVLEVRAGVAIGMDWTHPDFRASAMTEDGRSYGLVEPERSAFREQDRLRINGIPFHAQLSEGERILTSGLGGVFPRGIPVGTVQGLAEAEAGWRRSYWISPLVDPGSATHVLVGLVDRGELARDLGAAWQKGPGSDSAEVFLEEFGHPPGLDPGSSADSASDGRGGPELPGVGGSS